MRSAEERSVFESAEGEDEENPALTPAIKTSKLDSQDTPISNTPAQIETNEPKTQNLRSGKKVDYKNLNNLPI